MRNDIIGTLHLRGMDSIELFRELFVPTKETIERVIEANERISDGITIRDVEDGFMATVDDLDLSFLDDDMVLIYDYVDSFKIHVEESFVNGSAGMYSINMRNMLDTTFSEMPKQSVSAKVA